MSKKILQLLIATFLIVPATLSMHDNCAGFNSGFFLQQLDKKNIPLIVNLCYCGYLTVYNSGKGKRFHDESFLQVFRAKNNRIGVIYGDCDSEDPDKKLYLLDAAEMLNGSALDQTNWKLLSDKLAYTEDDRMQRAVQCKKGIIIKERSTEASNKQFDLWDINQEEPKHSLLQVDIPNGQQLVSKITSIIGTNREPITTFIASKDDKNMLRVIWGKRSQEALFNKTVKHGSTVMVGQIGNTLIVSASYKTYICKQQNDELLLQEVDLLSEIPDFIRNYMVMQEDKKIYYDFNNKMPFNNNSIESSLIVDIAKTGHILFSDAEGRIDCKHNAQIQEYNRISTIKKKLGNALIALKHREIGMPKRLKTNTQITKNLKRKHKEIVDAENNK